MRIFVNNIVKNNVGDTIGYDLTDLDTGNVGTAKVEDILSYLIKTVYLRMQYLYIIKESHILKVKNH